MATIPKHHLLNTGARMPSLGYGTFLSKSSVLTEALTAALDTGYRHIDTAVSYGNESEIGNVLSSYFRTGKLRREDVFLTTKVPSVYLAQEDVELCVLESLERLQVKYIDMVLIHNPWGLQNLKDGNLKPTDKNGKLLLAHHNHAQTWHAMEQTVKKGYTKGIGLSNFNQRQIETLLHNSEIKPGNLQLECHAYLRQDQLRQFCANNNIVVTGYSPFGSPARPEDRRSPDEPHLLADPTIARIAEELKREPGQILLRYVMQLGVIPLPKSTDIQRIRDNYNAQFFTLSDVHMKRIANLNINYKYFKFTWAKHHPEFDKGADF